MMNKLIIRITILLLTSCKSIHVSCKEVNSVDTEEFENIHKIRSENLKNKLYKLDHLRLILSDKIKDDDIYILNSYTIFDGEIEACKAKNKCNEYDIPTSLGPTTIFINKKPYLLMEHSIGDYDFLFIDKKGKNRYYLYFTYEYLVDWKDLSFKPVKGLNLFPHNLKSRHEANHRVYR